MKPRVCALAAALLLAGGLALSGCGGAPRAPGASVACKGIRHPFPAACGVQARPG